MLQSQKDMRGRSGPWEMEVRQERQEVRRSGQQERPVPVAKKVLLVLAPRAVLGRQRF